MKRVAELARKTGETEVHVLWNLDAPGPSHISTGIPFFDHMLTLFALHGFFTLSVRAKGDLEVDFHHTVEDIGIVMGDTLRQALGDKKGIRRFGHAVTPMDEALSSVAIDLSDRPYLVYHVPTEGKGGGAFDVILAKEFFRAFVNHAGMNLHIHVPYGENEHHMIESLFKGSGRALGQAVSFDDRNATHVRSTKGTL